MENIFTTDWHIHTEASYDATMPYEELIQSAKESGITEFGITEHVNYPFMIKHLQISKDILNRKLWQHRDENLKIHLGVELSPGSNFFQQYTVEREWPLYPPLYAGSPGELIDLGMGVPELIKRGYEEAKPYVLAMTEEDIRANGVEYVVAAAHGIIDVPLERNALIAHYRDQQLFCATDPRVDVVGHPWLALWSVEIHKEMLATGEITQKAWFQDFSVVPQSIHDEFAAALLENGKSVEMNVSMFFEGGFSEKFRQQYAQYMRMLFEKGVPVTIGTDSHDRYPNVQEVCAKYLRAVGFKAEDFSKPRFRVYE